jgi:hypothetical protein
MIEGNSLSILPTLINSRDTFTLKFLLAEYTNDAMKITGRIAGVREVTKVSVNKAWVRLRVLLALASGVSLAVFVALLFGGVEGAGWVGLIAFVFYVSLISIESSNKVPKNPPKKK